MLIIRDAQKAVFQRGGQEQFAVRLAHSLSATFPERFPEASPEAAQFAQRAIGVALRHGINTEHAIASFANLRAAFGEAFEWTPVAGDALALLRDPDLPGPIKVAAISDCLYTATGGRPITFVAGEED